MAGFEVTTHGRFWVTAEGISPKALKYPALSLVWAIFIVTASLPIALISSVCFDWPKPFPQIIALLVPTSSTANATEGVRAAEFAGTITDALTQKTLQGVFVRAGSGSAPRAMTDSNGYFEFSLPDYSSGRVVVSFEKDGYEMLRESVLPSTHLDFAIKKTR